MHTDKKAHTLLPLKMKHENSDLACAELLLLSCSLKYMPDPEYHSTSSIPSSALILSTAVENALTAIYRYEEETTRDELTCQKLQKKPAEHKFFRLQVNVRIACISVRSSLFVKDPLAAAVTFSPHLHNWFVCRKITRVWKICPWTTLGLFPFQLSAPNIHEFKVTVTPTLHAFCFILLFLGTNSVFASIIPISFVGPTAALDLAVAQHILTRKGSYTHWAAGFNKTEVCFHANAWTLLQFHYKAD